MVFEPSRIMVSRMHFDAMLASLKFWEKAYDTNAVMHLEGDKLYLTIGEETKPIKEEGIIDLLGSYEPAMAPPEGTERPELYERGAASYFDRPLEVLAMQNAINPEPEWRVLMLWDPERNYGFHTENMEADYARDKTPVE